MNYYAHPTAVVESDQIGQGSKIWHFAHVRSGSIIGRNCNVGKSVYIDTGANDWRQCEDPELRLRL